GVSLIAATAENEKRECITIMKLYLGLFNLEKTTPIRMVFFKTKDYNLTKRILICQTHRQILPIISNGYRFQRITKWCVYFL
ncbi:hypothetical protein, partial [Xenorhabdus bovienii]|uniref:hypothetical protein n=1 Tax=Xenorhabdus bovienii TaxID=40576 RepID=UPI001E556ACF